MIWFFSLERASAGVCDNYDDFFQYLYGKLELKDTQLTETLVIDGVDTHTFKKQWCLDYCKAHNYLIIENIRSKDKEETHAPVDNYQLTHI